MEMLIARQEDGAAWRSAATRAKQAAQRKRLKNKH
jgi:hypothetical protein